MDIDDLITRSLAGHATPEEEIELSRWRRSDPRNEHRWRELHRVWTLTGLARPELRSDIAAVPNFRSLLDRSPGIAGSDAPAPAERPAPRAVISLATRSRARHAVLLRRIASGAMAATLLAVGVGLGLLAHRAIQPSSLLASGEVVTGAGELATLTLGDGSTIRLGPESRLRLEESRDSREVWLAGRAFFAVQRDSLRPFIVRTELGDALALGTRFEVRTEPEELRVLVVEGRVALEAGDTVVQLSGGEASRAGPGAPPKTQPAGDVYAQLEWLGNAVAFQSTPLSAAVEEIEHRFHVRVAIEDPSIAQLTVTASFTGRSVEEMLLVMCEITGSRCARDADGTFRIVPRE